MTETNSPPNPYVGPVTFTYADRHRYFGREREARDLLSLVIAERLTLFYAQSGAGKSSLLNTRLIPGLREQARYLVLPVGRVGGALPQGVTGVENIYAFNLMLSLDRPATTADATRFAALTLANFLDGLYTADGLQYIYDEATAQRAAARRTTATPAATRNQPPHVLIIDQFEEIITTHPQRWRERVPFFTQLAQAMQNDPLLWVVLTLREDFVAPLDPFAHLLPGHLSTRFYMERMGIDAALAAIKRPAADAGRPFTDDAAAQLVDNLRQVRVAGQAGTFPGQYVEPVQLQVACYQLWENSADDRMTGGQDDKMSVVTPSPSHLVTPSSGHPVISVSDLERVGDVDTALADFYEQALAAALALPDLAITERRVRIWVNQHLVTIEGTRSSVYRGPTETAGMSNAVVDVLQDRFLLRTELRSGSAWMELVHDRLVEPILTANRTWHIKDNNPVAAPYARWAIDKNLENLLRGEELFKVESYYKTHLNELTPEEAEYLKTSRQQWNEEQKEASRRRLGIVALALILGLIIVALLQFWSRQHANAEAALQDKIARSRQLAIQSANDLEAGHSDQALPLGIQAGSTYATSAAFSAIRNALAPPVLIVHRFEHGAGIKAIAWGGRQQVVSLGEDRRIVRWELTANQYGDEWAIPPALDIALSAAWNGDGTQLATGHQSGELVIWSLDGQHTTRKVHEGAVNTVDWHPEQRLIVTGGVDGMVRIWRPADVAPVDEFGIGAAVNRARWDAGGNRILIAGEDGSIHVWDREEQRRIFEIKAYPFPGTTTDISWYGESRQFLSAGLIGFSSQGLLTAAHLWNINDSSLPLPIQTFGGHSSMIRHTALNLTNDPQKARLATGSDDGIVRIWDVQSGLLLNALYGHTTAVSGLVWLSETELLTADSIGQMIRWSFTRTGELPLRDEYEARVSVLQWLAGDLILSAAHDGQGHLWRATDGEIVMPIQHAGQIDGARVHPDGSQLLTASADGTVGVWDLSTHQEITRLGPGRGRYVYARWNNTTPPTLVMAGYWCNESICPDGSRYEIHMWRVDKILPGQSPEPDLILTGHSGNIQSARWNLTDFIAPSGTRMATASYDGTIRIWDVALDSPTAGQTLQTLVHAVALTETTGLTSTTKISNSNMAQWVNEAKWNEDGSALLSYSNDQTARIWQWDRQTEQFVGRPPLLHGAAVVWADWFDNDRRVVTVSADGLGRAWDVQNGQLLHELAGHTDAIKGAYWTNDAKEQLLTVSADATAILWEISDGTLLRRFVGHGGPVLGAILDETEDLLLTYSEDTTARLWQLSTGELIAVLTGHTDDVMLVAWDRDRSRIVTGGMDGVVRQYYREMDDLLRVACQKLAGTTTASNAAESDSVASPCFKVN